MGTQCWLCGEKTTTYQACCNECMDLGNAFCACGDCDLCEDIAAASRSMAREYRQELAMEAGMLGGCDAHNETLGY